MEQVKERMGADVGIVFGQTEASGGLTLTVPGDSFEKKSATVGIPYPHVDVKIIDPATGEVKVEFQPNSSTGGPGDKLHPNRAGYAAMGNAIDLGMITK